MVKDSILERYLKALLSGDRIQCRSIIEETLQSGVPAHQVYMDIIWPIMVEIDKLYRQDTIDSAQEAFASRINRTIVNQLQNKLPRRPGKNKRVVVVTAQTDLAELGGQMTNDMFESDGWETRFLGGSVGKDDIMTFIHGYVPDILLLYGFNGKDAPTVRGLIDLIRNVNAFPQMRIMLSGGVFSRAEGLWEEIGADLYAETAAEAVVMAQMPAERLPQPARTIKQRYRGAEEVSETVETLAR
ncbi:MAG: B12-binding domain-containing protein [Planctomycetales bacterium]|nr:B12-binding domain-containing protein [Planctomycetales bacterium]